MAILIVPKPKRVEAREGFFALKTTTPIVLPPAHSGSDFLAASLLADEFPRWLGRRPAVEAHARLDGLGPAIVLIQFERDRALLAADPPAEPIGDEGYLVDVTPERVVAAARTDAGLFYAVQTLRQLIEPRGRLARFPACRIVDWPDFRYRGVMHDISRFKVPKLSTLIGLVERLAALKVNVLQLYTEHTFASRRHPSISAGCDPLTADDLMILDTVCRNLHVELQPNLQSFGHHEHLLRQPAYAHLAESAEPRPWTLTPVREETYQLLDDLYAEYLPCHTSRFFNADCDETYDLGKGQSANKAAELGLGRLYLGHIRRLNDLAKQHGRRLMIWADIIEKHLDLIAEVPDDVLLLDWQYGIDTHAGTSETIAATKRLEHWVCPGTSAWSTLWAQVERAEENIAQMARLGRTTGATGVLNTDWGDGGHPNPLSASFHGFAFGAEQSWTADETAKQVTVRNPPTATAAGGKKGSGTLPSRSPTPFSGLAEPTLRQDFDRRFAWAFFRDRTGRMGRLYRLLGKTNAAFGLGRWQGMPFHLFWETFPDGKRLLEAKPGEVRRCQRLAERALALATRLRKSRPEDRTTLDECILAAKQTLFACRKYEVAAAVRKGDGRVALRPAVKSLAKEWTALRDEFERLWLVRNRRSQIDYRLGLYAERLKDFA